MNRAGLALALATLLAVSGCLSHLEEGLQAARDDGVPEPSTEDTELAFAPAPGPADRAQVDTTLTVPEAVEGLLIRYELSLEDAGDVEAWLDTPDDERIDLVSRTTTEATKEDGQMLVPPLAGDWQLTVDASAPGQLALEVTIHEQAPELTLSEPAGPTRPVVAVVDTGINPYHEVFQREQLATGVLPERISLEDRPLSVPISVEGTYNGSLAADAALWAHVPDQQLVHFAGTNVLGYQLDDTELPQAPVLDRAGHGTSVAHAVVDEAPEAIVVMVTGADYDEGVRWAAEQGWVDLVSLSWGPAVNAAGAAEPYAGGFTTPEATRAVNEAGKLVFAASGNDPTLTVTDTTTGPPWVHAVSGAQPDTKARAAMSGNLIDTVANWTQDLAEHTSRDETSNGSGTSFATPRTAGIAAHALGQVRNATGHEAGIQDGQLVATESLTVANSDLRSAMNRSAVYWNTTDYEGPTDPGPSIPVAPTPWVSMGWGYLDGTRADVIVDALLGHELPDKSAEAEAWMDRHQDSRERYWRAR